MPLHDSTATDIPYPRRHASREGSYAPASAVRWTSGDLEIDDAKWIVRSGGVEVDLTRKEFAIVRILIAARGAAVPRKALWSKSNDALPNTSRSLDAHIWSLRKKVEKDPRGPRHILTITRFGYRLA